jgi:hypothetical protein
MKTLSKRNYLLISMSMQQCGFHTPSDAMMYEEQMYCHEAGEIWAFVKWLHKNNMGIGSANYQERFKEFKKQYIEPMVEPRAPGLTKVEVTFVNAADCKQAMGYREKDTHNREFREFTSKNGTIRWEGNK